MYKYTHSKIDLSLSLSPSPPQYPRLSPSVPPPPSPSIPTKSVRLENSTLYTVYIVHVHNSMYDWVSLHLWCMCVCVFRMLFEKPVLLTADYWYTAVACVSSPIRNQLLCWVLEPLDRTREVQYIQHMYRYMYVQCTLYIYLQVCTHNVYLMYTSYLSSSISRYMYMYKTL